MKAPNRSRSILPGFGLSLGYTVFYLGTLVLLPLAALAIKGMGITLGQWRDILLDPQTLAAFRLSLQAAAAAAGLNAVFGFITAWVLVRYRFPGRKILEAMVDLPFALPTAVAGIALTSIYAPTAPLGKFLIGLGLPVAYAPLGVVLALSFIGIPFVVRTVQPVIAELDREVEEAASCLGASRWQTFTLLTFPTLLPALITGAALAFARALGEYGSVVFISGNLPFRTEIVPLLIAGRLERFDYAGATALALTMLILSFLIMLGINALQRRIASDRSAH